MTLVILPIPKGATILSTVRRTNPHRKGQATQDTSMPAWMKWASLLLAVVILISAGAFALSQKGLIATVNGEKVSSTQLQKMYSYYLIRSPELASYYDANTLLNEILHNLVLNTYQMQIMSDWNISIDKDAVEKQYAEDLPYVLAAHLRMEGSRQELDFDYSTLLSYGEDGNAELAELSVTDKAYLEELLGTTAEALLDSALTAGDLTIAEYKNIMRTELMIHELDDAIDASFDDSATDEEIETLYNEYLPNRYQELDLSHILRKNHDENQDMIEDTQEYPLFPEEKLAEFETEMNNMLAELKNGADFATMAEEHSDDTSAVVGGSLGALTREAIMRQYVAVFREAAAALTEEGQLSDVILSEFGYHIIRLNEITTTPITDVEDTLRSEIEIGKANSLRADLLNKVDIMPSDVGTSVKSYGWISAH